MKLYRVLANSFLSKGRLDETNPTGLEGIYYTMGYTYFREERCLHAYNNIYKTITEAGKYFFLFFEDALKYGTGLLNCFHQLYNIQSFTIVEYDIPIEIVLKNIGYGDYTDSIIKEYAIETYINQSDLGETKLSTEEISDEQKKSAMINFFNETLKKLNLFQEFSLYDYRYYLKQFEEDLWKVLEDPKTIERQIIGSPLFKSILFDNRTIVESPFITGTCLQINQEYYYYRFMVSSDSEKIKDYFSRRNICCDFSEEQQSFKNELLYYAGTDGKQKESEEIKKLLKERKYI